MYCEKCGKEIENGSKFCTHCSGSKSSVGKEKLGIIGAAIAGVAAIIVLCVLLFGSKSIVLNDYISVEFSGYNTVGEAEVILDEEAFLAVIEEGLSEEKFEQAYLLMLFGGINIDLSETENLSNGDTIQLVAEVTEKLEEFGLKIKVDEESFVVEGLEEAEVLDLFEDIEITYTGCEPYGKAAVESTSTHPFIREYVTYRAPFAKNLSVGDTFHVVADYSETAALESGYIIRENAKEYTVDKLPAPVELDIMECIEVTFGGVEGEGEASVRYKTEDKFVRQLRFNFSDSYYLSEGDVITLSVKNIWQTDPLIYGYTFEECEFEFTVPALGRYIISFDQISQEDIKTLLARADEVVHAEVENTSLNYYAADTLSTAEAVENLELKEVIAYRKDTAFNSGYYIAFVYSVDVTGYPDIEENSGNVEDGYVYAYVHNPIVEADGTLSFDPEEAVCMHDVFFLSHADFMDSMEYAEDIVYYDLSGN